MVAWGEHNFVSFPPKFNSTGSADRGTSFTWRTESTDVDADEKDCSSAKVVLGEGGALPPEHVGDAGGD